MARRVRGGVSATTYWLVAFVFLFVIALALAILFYNQREQSADAYADAISDLNTYAAQQDRSDAKVAVIREEAAKNNRSVLRQMLTEIELLQRSIGVPNTNALDEARAERNVPEGQPLLTYIDNTRGELTSVQTQLAQLQQLLKEREEALAKLGADYQNLRTSRDEKIAELTANLTQLQGDLTAYQQQVDNAQKQINDALAGARDAAEKEIRARDAQLKSLQEKLTSAQQRIKEVTTLLKRETPDVPDQSVQPDGRIIATVADEQLVYIDLGQSDHLVLGMTFEVFDSVRGVQVGEGGQMRGKATVEVVDIGERSATARVIRASQSRPVLAGDAIANLVYDKDRVFKFYVFGEFDLDGDGQYTVTDRDSIVRQIQQWGGTVVSAREREARLAATMGEEVAETAVLPLDTDFVLIGQEPELPQPVAPGERDPIKIRKAVLDKQRWDDYIQVRNEAVALSIPVINHNRFLALIGHVRNK